MAGRTWQHRVGGRGRVSTGPRSARCGSCYGLLGGGWLAVGGLLLCLGLAASPAQAQDDEEFIPDADEETTGKPDFSAIDDLLKRDEESLTDSAAYSYDPGSRRDPFRSLQRRSSTQRREGKRPDGPAGLLIDEISLEGVFVLDDGPVVQVQSASQRTSFLLRVGDQLWDGDVIRITLQEVVFKQSVNDPTALKPFREIVKKLR